MAYVTQTVLDFFLVSNYYLFYLLERGIMTNLLIIAISVLLSFLLSPWIDAKRESWANWKEEAWGVKKK